MAPQMAGRSRGCGGYPSAGVLFGRHCRVRDSRAVLRCQRATPRHRRPTPGGRAPDTQSRIFAVRRISGDRLSGWGKPPLPPPLPCPAQDGTPYFSTSLLGGGYSVTTVYILPPPLHMPASRRRIRGLILADDHFSHWGGTCVWRNTAAAKLNDGVQHDYTALDSLVDQGSRGVP
jgi:hypothetical protein